MGQTVCRGCGGVIDFEDIPAFTLCECSDCGTELVIPRELDFLKLENPLFETDLFEVFEGFDANQNMDSTIFLMKEDIEEYSRCAEIAKDEASALSTLKHANICPLINYGTVNGRFFATEPKMDGFSLADYAPEAQGQLDAQKVVDVMQAAGLGLAIAHHKELPHHNLCPENVHIDARGNVRLKNYIISRTSYAIEQALEKKSSVSAYFISPEKAESGLEDKRGDVFSFGVLFYYMLSGDYPFVGRNEIETVYSRVQKKKKTEDLVFNETANRLLTPETVDYIPPTPLGKLREDIDDLGDLVMRMLEYHPFKRPTLPEFLDVMNLYQARLDQTAGVVAAQKEMVVTKTRAIPKMNSLNSKKEKKKKKRRFFL